MLTRETDWRQGDLLTHETAAKLTTLNRAVDQSRRVVVITHDCDLPNDSETSVEVIVADVVSAPDAQFSYAKNPRKLHLRYGGTGGQTVAVELRHAERCIVSKDEFKKHATRDDHALLPVSYTHLTLPTKA